MTLVKFDRFLTLSFSLISPPGFVKLENKKRENLEQSLSILPKSLKNRGPLRLILPPFTNIKLSGQLKVPFLGNFKSNACAFFKTCPI